MSILEFLFGGLFSAIDAMGASFPFVIFIALAAIFWEVWVLYIQQLSISKEEMILLEIRLPKELTKSPRAMEIILGTFAQGSPSNWYAAYYEGKVRAFSSLEIVSDGGKVYFYMYMRKGLKNAVEAQIYAQYPQVEIHEADDYTKKIPYGSEGSDYELSGSEYKLAKEDAYPIKTYVDYGLDKDPEEEFKIDPLTSVIETLGSIGPGEHIWLQIIIMATDPYPARPGSAGLKSWKDQGKEIIEKITKRNEKPEDKINFAKTNLTPREREVLEAVERNLSKTAFDVGMRVLYIARKDKFNKGIAPAIGGLMRPFGSNDLNSFKGARGTSVDFPWQDPFGIKVAKRKRNLFEAYCKRGYFYYPYTRKPFVLSAEELATLYHFPGMVAETPTLGRIESKRGEAPLNLPV